MIVKVCLLLAIYIQSNVQCSNLVQIDKLHLITPKLSINHRLNNHRKLQIDQQPSFSSINYRTIGEERPSNPDQVASIQYELKIVQQKPLSNYHLSSTAQTDEQTEDTNKVNDIKSKKNDRKERKSISIKNESKIDKIDKNEENLEDKQQTKLSQASSILQHYPSLASIHQKQLKQQLLKENHHSYLIHHSYPQNSLSSYSQPINQDRYEPNSAPEVKKIVHIHHYHHEHIGNDKGSKSQEKEQEKRTEKLVEKQVQEAVLKNFERELEKEHQREMKKKRKAKGLIKKFNTLDEEPWKPVKYSELLSKINKKKANLEQPNFDDEDDFKAYSHNYNNYNLKLLKKRPKELEQIYEDDDLIKYRHRKRSRPQKEVAPHREYQSERNRYRNEDEKKYLRSNDYVDDQNEEQFLNRPLSADEDDFHKKQLESSDDYSFENDEHYLPNDSNRLILKRSKLNDEESRDSREIRKLNGKKKQLKENENSVKNEKVFKEKVYNDKVNDEKIYKNKSNPDKSYLDKSYPDKSYLDTLYPDNLYQDQSTDKPEIIFDLIRANQKLKKAKQEDQEPLIEILNENVSKRDPLRRNWLGLELITKSS